jgi:hypothetical protein
MQQQEEETSQENVGQAADDYFNRGMNETWQGYGEEAAARQRLEDEAQQWAADRQEMQSRWEAERQERQEAVRQKKKEEEEAMQRLEAENQQLKATLEAERQARQRLEAIIERQMPQEEASIEHQDKTGQGYEAYKKQQAIRGLTVFFTDVTGSEQPDEVRQEYEAEKAKQEQIHRLEEELERRDKELERLKAENQRLKAGEWSWLDDLGGLGEALPQ